MLWKWAKDQMNESGFVLVFLFTPSVCREEHALAEGLKRAYPGESAEENFTHCLEYVVGLGTEGKQDMGDVLNSENPQGVSAIAGLKEVNDLLVIDEQAMINCFRKTHTSAKCMTKMRMLWRWAQEQSYCESLNIMLFTPTVCRDQFAAGGKHFTTEGVD